MDPLTHAAFGVACALAAAGRQQSMRAVALAGLAGGLLPDADVFLKSASDPLFNIEYHRHFTHSIALSPVVAWIAALLAWALLCLRRPSQRWQPLWWPAWVAVLSHLFCDLWTSYGTRIGWPFFDTRAALHWVSVVDPLITLPLLIGLLIAALRKRRLPVGWALAVVGLYLALAVVQQQRAQHLLDDWVRQQGGEPRAWRATVKPSFGNIIVWRALAADQATLHVFAIRCGFGPPQKLPGTTTAMFPDVASALAHFALPSASRQANDIRRFFHFSDRWVGLDPAEPQVLADLRYAALPNQIAPLWGIRIKPQTPEAAIDWVPSTSLQRRPWAELWQMIQSGQPNSEVH